MRGRVLYAGLAAALVAAGGFVSPFAESPGAIQATQSATPRTPDGKPDLSGMWRGTAVGGDGTQQSEQEGGVTRLVAYRRCAPTQFRCHENTNQNNDGEFAWRTNPNRPIYKPEFWDRVQDLDYNTNYEDPGLRCQPLGVPRVGPPQKIVQTANEVIFLHAMNINEHDYRIIPTDGRSHDPLAFPTYYGDAVGRWEGDTLVVDIVSFNDITWLGAANPMQFIGIGGYFHSHDLHVIERFRREGNILRYQATVEDPKVLLEPWVTDAVELKLNTDLKATIPEGRACHDYDEAIIASRIRH